MSTTIIDGLARGQSCLEKLEREIDAADLSPSLRIVYAGSNSSSETYIKHKQKKAQSVGVDVGVSSFEAGVESVEVLNAIARHNADDEVDGIIVQLPLPDHLDTQEILNSIKPRKDVDGLHPVNFGRLLAGKDPLFSPPTPAGIIELLREYEVSLPGAVAVVVGMGRLVGKPLAQMLLRQEATVLCLHEHTRDPEDLIKQGDIVVTGVGKPDLIGGDDVKDGVTVIDAGINRVDGELVGDVNFEEVRPVASRITPVPGGVGPMTVACLLANTVKACRRH